MNMPTSSNFWVVAVAAVAVFFGSLSSSALADDDPGGPPGNGPPPHAGPPSRPGPPDWAGPPEDRGPPAERGPRFGIGRGQPDGVGNGIPNFCTPRHPGRQPGGPPGQAGLSSIALLDFAQSVEGGARGKLIYRWISPLFDYVFNARGLEPETAYTLTYQPEPIPSAGVICLGTGTATADGDLHLQDALDLQTDLPAAYDENEDEAALALVLAVDVDCEDGTMSASWDPSTALFAVEGMFYVRYIDEPDDETGDDDD